MSGFQLAQVNIALPREPLESDLLREFVEALDPINAIADGSPGFVWRLQGEDGNATSIRAFGDDRLIVNMSVWESIEALRAFVYTSGHVAVMRRRREWFDRIETHLALWWVPASDVPTVAEAEERVTLLSALGPSPDAFTFRRHYPAPDAPAPGAVDDDRWLCPA
jgi:uncharacterized protein DUF3291